jgi:hypothetical protein
VSALSCAVGVSLLWCFAFVVGQFTSCFPDVLYWVGWEIAFYRLLYLDKPF